MGIGLQLPRNGDCFQMLIDNHDHLLVQSQVVFFFCPGILRVAFELSTQTRHQSHPEPSWRNRNPCAHHHWRKTWHQRICHIHHDIPHRPQDIWRTMAGSSSPADRSRFNTRQVNALNLSAAVSIGDKHKISSSGSSPENRETNDCICRSSASRRGWVKLNSICKPARNAGLLSCLDKSGADTHLRRYFINDPGIRRHTGT